MNLVAEPPLPLRQAALVLHALADADRAWVLASLPEAQRGLLQPLLAELHQLGIPREQAFLDGEPEDAACGPQVREDSWLLDLDGDGVAALAVVLQAQPVQFIQALLAMRAWPWRAQLLESLGEEKRKAALAAMAAPPPRFQAAMLQALNAKWQAARKQGSVVPPGPWARARARLARIGRAA